VGRSELTFKDGVRQLKVGQAFLVALQHVHAAAEVVVDCGRINCVPAKAFFSNLSRSQVATKGPCRLISVVEHGSEAAVRKSLVRVVVNKVDFLSSHVAREGDVVFATGFVN